MNITPNSFSDGGEALTKENFLFKLKSMGSMEALDIGAESTAPMNESISSKEEWERWQMILPLIPAFSFSISADTYHPETISHLIKFWKDQKIKVPLIWNDVSGKFDKAVHDFLNEDDNFHYIYCHNRAPRRDLAGQHMNYVSEKKDILEELKEFFSPHIHPRVLFDPCLGFSKTYEQNWRVLDHFSELQRMIPHNQWLLGFSRKSFLRKKLNLEKIEKERLDSYHEEVLKNVLKEAGGEIWIRTHRPELLISETKS